jgi:hypothetical protein
MSKVVYSMSVSLDGFVETRDGKIDWTAAYDEFHRFFNDCARKVDAFLYRYGRRGRPRTGICRVTDSSSLAATALPDILASTE